MEKSLLEFEILGPRKFVRIFRFRTVFVEFLGLFSLGKMVPFFSAWIYFKSKTYFHKIFSTQNFRTFSVIFFRFFFVNKIFYLNSSFHLSPPMNLIMNRLLPVGGKLDYSLTVKLNPRAWIPSSSLLFNKIYVFKHTSEISLNYYNNFRYASVLRMHWGWESIWCIWQ